MTDLLLGIDIGTTKLCVIAFDGPTGKIHSARSAPNNTSIAGDSDAFEQNPTAIVGRVKQLIREVVDGLPHEAQIRAIGVTGQMHGVLLASENGEALSQLTTWQDQRGNRPFIATDRTVVEEVRHRLGEQQKLTGTNMATGFGAATLFRLKDQIPQKAKALTIHDFLVFYLTGEAVTDPTDAASWGIYDVATQTGWLPEVESLLELPQELLPRIIPTGTVAGHLTRRNAEVLGLKEGIPVAVALGDNQASFIGSVPSIRESILFNIGTGGQMSVASDSYAQAKGLDTRPLVKGQWLQVGASLCGGSALKILATFFAHVGSELYAIDTPVEKLYDQMVALAASADNAKLPRFEPLFQGTRSDPERSASITGLRPDNFDVAHLTRALLRGMMEELVGYCDTNIPRFVVGSGNGFRRNPVLRSEFASRLNVEVLLPPNQEEAAVGAAISAGIAVGLYSTWDEAGHILYTSPA